MLHSYLRLEVITLIICLPDSIFYLLCFICRQTNHTSTTKLQCHSASKSAVIFFLRLFSYKHQSKYWKHSPWLWSLLQETLEASNYAPAPPLVYSVLDFPKRSSAVLELNPSDTEYAAVSYLPEQRRVWHAGEPKPSSVSCVWGKVCKITYISFFFVVW